MHIPADGSHLTERTPRGVNPVGYVVAGGAAQKPGHKSTLGADRCCKEIFVPKQEDDVCERFCSS
jgi:hypothetical protein